MWVGRGLVLLVLVLAALVPASARAGESGPLAALYPEGGRTLICGRPFASLAEVAVAPIVPISVLAKAAGCASSATVAACQADNPRFARMLADRHDLYPLSPAVAAARGDRPFGEIENGGDPVFGDCAFARNDRVATPPVAARGDVARAAIYMAILYGLPLDPDLGALYVAWSRADPPSAAERRRNDLIERLQGNRNALIDDPALADTLGFASEQVAAAETCRCTARKTAFFRARALRRMLPGAAAAPGG